MSRFVWTEDLNLNIETIDNQHKRIVDYINELDDKIKAGDYHGVTDVAEKIVGYAYEHFQYEEGLMREAGYPLLDAHIEVHKSFKKGVEKSAMDIAESVNIDMSKANKLRSDLTLWLTNHIKKEDAQYKDLVQKLYKKETFFDKIMSFFK